MANEQIPELKPCPFCGDQGDLIDISGDDDSPEGFQAACIRARTDAEDYCPASPFTRIFNTRKKAVAAWNTRVPTNDLREGQMHLAMELEAKDEQIRKLREALWGIGSMPNGFCCCPAFRDPDKESHCGECTMARAALKEGE